MTTNVESLITQLSSDDPSQKAAAAEALARLGDDARPAAAVLVESCGSPDNSVRDWAVAALEELGPPPLQQISRLTDLAGDTSLDVAYWAVTLLGRSGDDAVPAVGKLAELVRGPAELPVRERAAWALGEIGPAAEAAQPALTEAAANGSEPRLQRLAERALKSLSG